MSKRWNSERAHAWFDAHGWPVGCNFTPSTACNQLEFWQAESFDPATLKHELDLAAGLGFNLIRVYLHDLLWTTDADGLLSRMDDFLGWSSERNIRVMFVFFDDCWANYAFPGTQPEPRPGVHNSQWLQSPGARHVINPQEWPRLQEYVQGVMKHFADDERIYAWDLYNEPGNEGMLSNSLALLKSVFQWARDIDPVQPLTSAPYYWMDEYQQLNDFQLAESDLITFHNYEPLDKMRAIVERLQLLDRPILCTEYMARPAGSTFETHLPYFKEQNIGAVNWGLVAGRIQTQFAWGAWPGAEEPPLWFHDIFRGDGSAYLEQEVSLIRKLTGA